MKYSIKHMLLLLAFAAVACTLLWRATWIGFFIIFNVLLLLYLATLVAAVLLPGRTRVFCIGFSIFGISYFMLTNLPSFGDYLASRAAFAYAYNVITPVIPAKSPQPPVASIFNAGPQVVNPTIIYTAPPQPPQAGQSGIPQPAYPVPAPATAPPPLLTGNGAGMTPVPLVWTAVEFEPFVRIGGCLSSVFFGLCGGAFAVFISRERSLAE